MSDAALGVRAWRRRELRGAFGVPRITDCRSYAAASTSSRLSFVCVAVSETLEQLHYDQHGVSVPVRKRPHRADDVPCVLYAAAFRANRSCTFYRPDHHLNQRRQRPVPLQFLLARDQVPYAMGI